MTALRPLARPLPRRAWRGTSTVELITLLVVIGVLTSAIVGQFIPTQREVIDRAGPVLVAAAVLDARAVASANHYRYPTDATELAAGLNAVAATHSTDQISATYTAGPATAMDVSEGKGTVAISAYSQSPTSVGFAVLTSVGAGTDSRCLLAVDGLRSGTRYAVLNVPADNTSACAARSALACVQAKTPNGPAGTAADPYRVAKDDTCLNVTG